MRTVVTVFKRPLLVKDIYDYTETAIQTKTKWDPTSLRRSENLFSFLQDRS
jgi:hypothetical protein